MERFEQLHAQWRGSHRREVQFFTFVRKDFVIEKSARFSGFTRRARLSFCDGYQKADEKEQWIVSSGLNYQETVGIV